MNKNITDCFAGGRKAVVAYVTVGAPTLEESEAYIEELILAGAGVIELGVPFSDPTADGAVIQEAGQIALKNGVKLQDVLDLATRIRARHQEVVLVLFSYYNVLFSYGLKRLSSYPIDGILVVDLPYEERGELSEALSGSTIEIIPLIAPTTPEERIKKLVKGCSGFVYAITVCGVTGVRSELPPIVGAYLDKIRQIVKLPVVAGFGISNRTMLEQLSSHADGVVMGSILVKALLEKRSEEGIKLVREAATICANRLH